MDNNRTNTEYFAGLPDEELSGEVIARVRGYFDYLSNSGYLEFAKRSYTSYFGKQPYGGASSMEVTRGGEQGELSYLKVNHYRNIIQHLLNMTTSNRPAPQPKASNTDAKAQIQTELASGIIDYYMRDKKLEKLFRLAAEYALVLDEGFVCMDWNADNGAPIAVDPLTQQPVKEGDMEFYIGTTLDLIRDPSKLNGKNDWYIVRTFINKFDLAAQYPEKADQIKAINFSEMERYRYGFIYAGGEQSSEIPVYTFMHKRTPSMPQGRIFKVLEAGIFLGPSGPLPFKNLPVHRMVSSDLLGTIFGYTPARDLLGIQQVIDALYGVVITNQTTFGVQNILVPQGHNLALTQLGGGLNVIEYDTKLGKPEALNLTQTPTEIFNFIQQMEHVMETISGVNSVARGNPEASLKSGASLALVQSMAIQFSSGLQESFGHLLEQVWTGIIEFLQTFPKSKRVAAIVGKSRQMQLKEFGPEDISSINSVVVDITNPLSKTVSGRLEIARDLLQNGMVSSASKYLGVLATGNLEVLVEEDEKELTTIQSENEALRDQSYPVRAVITDCHSKHIREHKAVINTPEARSNPQLVAAVTQHIQEHIDMLRNVDPILLQIIGEQPAPPAGPPQGAPQGPQGPQQPQPPKGPVSAAAVKRPDQSQANPNVRMPQMPTNPLTGKKATPNG